VPFSFALEAVGVWWTVEVVRPMKLDVAPESLASRLLDPGRENSIFVTKRLLKEWPVIKKIA